MSNRERIRILRSTKELARFGESQLRHLASYVDEQCVGAGSQLAAEGRLCHQLLIVASGRLEACRDGRREVLEPGDIFGWRAMRERGLNEASVSAVTASHLLVMSHEQFRAVDGLTLS